MFTRKFSPCFSWEMKFQRWGIYSWYKPLLCTCNKQLVLNQLWDAECTFLTLKNHQSGWRGGWGFWWHLLQCRGQVVHVLKTLIWAQSGPVWSKYKGGNRARVFWRLGDWASPEVKQVFCAIRMEAVYPAGVWCYVPVQFRNAILSSLCGLGRS